MIFGCSTPNIDMLQYITNIKSLNLDAQHVARKDNAMEDMLSRARCQEKIEELVDDEEELDFFKIAPITVERDDER